VLLRSVAGEDLRLAALAAETWPERAAAHFWLGHALAAAGRDAAAAAAYRRGLSLRPSAARVWLELGDLVAGDDPEAALAAYGEACRRGDPSANACVRAGATAERLGDVAAALDWYRASRWEAARARADALERRLGKGPRPP
jgi:tetratricopeptide (TPR) repeat protein